jgi:hypothetical protein
MKKLCRLSKPYQERFNTFLEILGEIEASSLMGSKTIRIKHEICSALKQLKTDSAPTSASHLRAYSSPYLADHVRHATADKQ